MAQCEHPAVTTFREYIKIKTVQPNPDYETCTRFLKRQGKELGAKLHVMECVPGKPIIIMTVEGRDPTLPSLLLNSHTDVVPVFPGGVQLNVVPAQPSVGFDVRVAPTVEPADFESMLQGWCREAGQDVVFEIDSKVVCRELSCVEDGQSPWWDAFSQACKKEKITVQKRIFPAGTDSKFIRKLGIPSLGFSPMNNTERLLHDNNERLNEKVFLRGIEIYASIISALANCTP